MGFGGGGGGSTTSTVNNKSDPWEGIQQYLSQAAGDISNLYNSGQLQNQWYPGSTIASQSPETQQALSTQAQLGANGTQVGNSAKGYLTSLLNGDFLSPESNPYLKGTFDQAANAVQGKVNSAFAGGGTGSYGSGINKQMMTKELGNVANNIYGGAYQQGKQQQLAGAALAPQIGNQDYIDAGQLGAAGAAKDQYSQSLLNEDINKFNFNQQQPTNALQNFISLLNQTGGQYGQSTGTTTQPYYGGGGGMNTLGLLGMGGSLLGSSGLLGSAGGAMGGLGGLASLASMFSDARLKENIAHVGYEKDIPIYHFNYISDPEKVKWRGVMAQDVIGVMPEAVGVRDGYATVNYDMIGIKPERLN